MELKKGSVVSADVENKKVASTFLRSFFLLRKPFILEVSEFIRPIWNLTSNQLGNFYMYLLQFNLPFFQIRIRVNATEVSPIMLMDLLYRNIGVPKLGML